jgi:thiamine pyrophosphate-dependent acetolactate synthase large subunit-like protein
LAYCAHLSNSTRRRQNPARRQLVDLGMAGVPALIELHHRAPRTLETLLRQITMASPTDGLERVEEWQAAWRDWARARGLMG